MDHCGQIVNGGGREGGEGLRTRASKRVLPICRVEKALINANKGIRATADGFTSS